MMQFSPNPQNESHQTWQERCSPQGGSLEDVTTNIGLLLAFGGDLINETKEKKTETIRNYTCTCFFISVSEHTRHVSLGWIIFRSFSLFNFQTNFTALKRQGTTLIIFPFLYTCMRPRCVPPQP